MCKFIVKYVRDKNDNRPIGCVVAIDRDILGCCYLNKADRPKTKKELVNLALERANKRKFGEWKISEEPFTYRTNDDMDVWYIPQCMREIYNEMKDRSHRYFKQETEDGRGKEEV